MAEGGQIVDHRDGRDVVLRLRADGRLRLAEVIEHSVILDVRIADVIASILASQEPELRAFNFAGELVAASVKPYGDSGAASLCLVEGTPSKLRICVVHFVYKFPGQRHWACVLAVLFAAYFSVFPLNPTFAGDGNGVVQMTRMFVPRALGQASAAANGILRVDLATHARRLIDGSPGKTVADVIREGLLSDSDIILLAARKIELVYAAAVERGEFSERRRRRPPTGALGSF